MDNKILKLTDQPYGPHVRQKFDLALPENCCSGLVLLIHGGAWISGDKHSAHRLVDGWAEKGYAVAAINYHFLSPDTHMDTLIQDIDLSLKAIREKALENGVTLSRVMLAGVSAGAHMSLLYAYSMADRAPIKPVCVMDYCGPSLLTDLVRSDPPEQEWIDLLTNATGIPYLEDTMEECKAELVRYSPVTYVNENTVPTIICHGQKDNLVPYSNAVGLRNALEANGAEYIFLPMPKADHGLEQKEIYEESERLFEMYAERFLRDPDKDNG